MIEIIAAGVLGAACLIGALFMIGSICDLIYEELHKSD